MTQDTNIRPDLLEVIRRTFPGGVVDMPTDREESYLSRLRRKLRRRLAKLPGGALLYERDWAGQVRELGQKRRAAWSAVAAADDAAQDEWAVDRGEGHGNDDDGSEGWAENCNEEPVEPELSSSYDLFFVGLKDPQFQRRREIESEDQEGRVEVLHGTETYGCVVGVSVLAPLAVIKLDCATAYEESGWDWPDLERQFEVEGRWQKAEEAHRGHLEAGTLKALEDLRADLTRELELLRVTVVPAAEARKSAPWLRPGEEAFLGKNLLGRDITVEDAFFFRGP